MKLKRRQPIDDIKRLQRCIKDLVSIIALPATWSGAEPSQIVRTLLDVLPVMLGLDLLYVRVQEPAAGSLIEIVHVAHQQPDTAPAPEIAAILNRWLGPNPEKRPQLIPSPIGRGDLSIVALRLGLQGEIGVMVAGAERKDFPGQTEKLLLSVAANQAVIGLQQARLLRQEVAEHRLADERLRLEAELRGLRDRYVSLSPREREVMALVVSGLLNKQVGGELGISEITVKAHRGQVMRKMRADSLPDLVTMAARLRAVPVPRG
jgi:DNA-binding CsgD family transcriptional regulator